MNLPIELSLAADGYALSFSSLTNTEKMRLREAVLYGASLVSPAARVLEASEEINENHLMPFGKYQGKRMGDIPAVYYMWLYDNSCNHAGVKKYIIDRFETLKKEADKARRN